MAWAEAKVDELRAAVTTISEGTERATTAAAAAEAAAQTATQIAAQEKAVLESKVARLEQDLATTGADL